MYPSLLQILLSLLAGILVIIVGTTSLKLPAFFALLFACFVTGLGLSLSLPELLSTMKTGFGNVLQSLGFIIVLGTALGVVLEHSGATTVMAEYILKKTGEKNASLAISITGLLVGLPVFCDSGFIVLSGLNKSMIRKTGIAPVTMSVSLAAGLYSVHCLLPPHPGAAAAAGSLGVDFGKLILYGLLIAIPVMLIGHAWAVWSGKKWKSDIDAEDAEQPTKIIARPGVLMAFLPVLVPIILITFRSLLTDNPSMNSGWAKNLLALGDPVIALLIALLISLAGKRNWNRPLLSGLMHDALEKAGSILLIIGAGGAFGAILAATRIGDHFAAMSFLKHLGLLFPFLLTVVLKTAQGSSTVAIITASSILLPLLPLLGLDNDSGRLFSVLAMGAGSMMISHANDAYFWVISKFSGIDTRTMLRTYSIASILMGVSAFLLTWLLSLIIA